jgi:hypothetical protein
MLPRRFGYFREYLRPHLSDRIGGEGDNQEEREKIPFRRRYQAVYW